MTRRHLHASVLFPGCGHRKRPSNPGPKCGICTEAKWRKCQHPRNESNTYTPKNGRPTCRTCRNLKAKEWRMTHADPRWDEPRRWKAQHIPAPRPLPSEVLAIEPARSYSLAPARDQQRSA